MCLWVGNLLHTLCCIQYAFGALRYRVRGWIAGGVPLQVHCLVRLVLFPVQYHRFYNAPTLVARVSHARRGVTSSGRTPMTAVDGASPREAGHGTSPDGVGTVVGPSTMCYARINVCVVVEFHQICNEEQSCFACSFVMFFWCVCV